MVYPSIPNKEFKWTNGADVQATWRKHGWVPPSEQMILPLEKTIEKPVYKMIRYK